MADITQDDVLKLAKLSHLQLSKEQITRFAKDLNELVAYAEQLQRVDVSGLEPTDQVTGLVNAWREDEILEYTATPDDLLKNAPATEAHQVKVKRVIE